MLTEAGGGAVREDTTKGTISHGDRQMTSGREMGGLAQGKISKKSLLSTLGGFRLLGGNVFKFEHENQESIFEEK